MEAVEDTTLEPAIGWLADTILANLPAGGKLDSWIRQAGLGNDVEKLKSEVEAVEMAVSAVQGRAAGNKPLARSLAAVKELLYDADDMVDELDHCRLQQELQPETLLETDGHGTHQVERSSENADDVQGSSNRRSGSEVWIHFDITEHTQNGGPAKAKCKLCQTELMCDTRNGTSVLHNHLKSQRCAKKRGASDPSSSTAYATTIPVPVVTGSRKRMRTGQESTHIIAANPNDRWNKDAFSERIQDITSQLQGKHEAITRLLKVLPSDSVGASSSHCQTTISDPRRRTSGLFQGKVYGRAQERGSIKTLIKEHKSTTGVTVLPIVGIGGVGKTALAQLVYHDSAVESHFDHKIWIWVSKDFDEMRLTREMLDCVSQETYDGLCSFTKLQEVLRGHIKSKRVLLILDDVWEVMDDCRWNKLLAPFKSGDGANGNMIILTTRKPSVAKKRGTIIPINLDGLKNDAFWLFFEACTFGDENYEEQVCPSEIARQMTKRLQGNPLAAETVGTLLREHLTMDYWSNILKTGDWKSLQHTGGIMSSLKLSYDELPYHLQQCFSYFSIFPYNYQFLAEELVSHWISQGFVKHDYSSKSLEEIGQQYLSGLVNLGLVESKRSFFGGRPQTYYAMCGLMHDFARLVSRTECATLDGFQCTEVFPTVHHLSILTNSVYRRNDQTGNIPRNEKFEIFLQNIVTSVRNLRTLVLIGEYDSFFFKAFQDVFGKAHNLRLLQMSAASPDFNSFLFSLVNPTRLRYLKLHDVHTEQRLLLGLVNPTRLRYPKLHDVHTEQKALPHVLRKFFHLQVLDVAFFRSFHTVHLDDCGEWRILPSLEMLQFLKRLRLRNMRRVREVMVPPLEELVLDGMPDLQRCSCTSVRDMKSSLRVLEIQSCPALEVFDLFKRGDNFETEHKPWLPSLKRLIMYDCPHLQVQIPLPPSATFSELIIRRVSAIMTMDGSSMETFKISRNGILGLPSGETMALDGKILAFHNLKHIKYLAISSCTDLTFISFQGLSQLISLQSLRIASCRKLFSSDDVPEHTHEDMITATGAALPFLKGLYITDCGITGKWLSLILRHSPTLKELGLHDCPQLKLLTTEEKGKIQSNLLPTSEASSSGYLDDAFRSSVHTSSGYVADAWPTSVVDGVVHIPLNLRKITIGSCPHLIFDGSKEGFAGFTSLEEEVEEDGQDSGRCLLPQALEHLDWSDYSRKTLRPCFVGNLTCLRKLEVTRGSLEYLQLDSCTSLEELKIRRCEQLVALQGMQSLGTLRYLVLYGNVSLESLQLHSCTALKRLEIHSCSCSSLVTLEGMESLVNLRSLVLYANYSLESLQLHSCTALKRLEIQSCSSLVTLEGMESLVNLKHLEILGSPVALEGLQSLVNLKHLKIDNSPALDSLTALESIEPTEGISSHRQEFFPALERLEVHDSSPLNTSFCKDLTCLRSLKLTLLYATRLTDEQERALLLLRSLQELCFEFCDELVDLPAGLRDLPSLKTLTIKWCCRISGLPKKGLPPSLEKLEIKECSDELLEGCRSLATIKLEVKIDEDYVD